VAIQGWAERSPILGIREARIDQVARTPRPEGPWHRDGAGLGMALAAAATFVNAEALYAHLIHPDAVRMPDIRNCPMLDSLSTARLLVGPRRPTFLRREKGAYCICESDRPASTPRNGLACAP